MKKIISTLLSFIVLFLSACAEESPKAAKISPLKSQKHETIQTLQKRDETLSAFEKLIWETDMDHAFELAKKEQAQESPPAEPNSSRRGAGARGALRGAAGGALVGEIVDDDASKGAAIGATVGAIGARRNARKAEKAEQASAEQAAEKTAAASEQQMGNFKKGFAACLEGKDYTVKY